MHFEVSPVRPMDVVQDEEPRRGGWQPESSAYSDGLSAESDDNDEIYYASDILDNATAVDIQPRSKLDFVYEGEEMEPIPDRSPSFPTAMEAAEQVASGDGHKHESRSSTGKDREAESLQVNTTSFDQGQPTMKRPSSRLDYLAQPRNHTFAEREKQRLLLEMEQLRECTFHPNVLKPPRSLPKEKALSSTGRPGITEFQWLTLSPRQKIFRRDENSSSNEACDVDQNVIQRLHLDGTARYDSRERARAALEAQEMEECTFKPKINPTSKSMFSMVDHKPLHHRVSDLQRAKVG